MKQKNIAYKAVVKNFTDIYVYNIWCNDEDDPYLEGLKKYFEERDIEFPPNSEELRVFACNEEVSTILVFHGHSELY